MIQEPGRRPYKRANRTKNRPVLVASTGQDAMVSPEQEDATLPSTTDSAVAVEAEPVISTTTTEKTPTPSRRLPGFFSTVGRKQQEETTTEADIAQARIARATRGKTPAKATSATEPQAKGAKAVAQPEPKKAVARPPTRGGFKTRYLFGMVLYLLAANFIGVILTNAFASAGIDRLLTTFNLFGGNIQIRTSTLAYLAILVVLLIALAYFDLIPRSFSAMNGGQRQPVKRGTSSSKQNSSDNVLVRNTPPPMRQGVKGADDDLYEEYRFNQRRSKKR